MRSFTHMCVYLVCAYLCVCEHAFVHLCSVNECVSIFMCVHIPHMYMHLYEHA